MRVLGIDYGERKTGVAIAEGKLAEPLVVIRHKNTEELISRLAKIIKEKKIEEVVVGVSEGVMGERQKAFGMSLAIETGVAVEFEDETLTTKDVQRLSLEAGMKQKKRKELEDAFSAALILQRWVDGQGL